MPKVTAATLSVTGLLLIALTGCSGGTDSAGEQRTAPTTSESETPEESAAPLTAETADPETTDADEVFLAYVRDVLVPQSQITDATDQQLIDAGHEACAQLEAGVAYEDVRVVEGEQPLNDTYYDSSAVMNGAITAYCSEYL